MRVALNGRTPGDWQPLEKHLKNVAEMARSVAMAFGAGDWGLSRGVVA